jgi:16S rRNA processing protein RimM
MDVVIPENMLPELDDEIYWSQLEGSPVLDINGDRIGELVDYMEGGSTEIFRIKCDDGYYLVSNNKDHVLKIDVKEKKLIVAREGLISEDL